MRTRPGVNVLAGVILAGCACTPSQAVSESQAHPEERPEEDGAHSETSSPGHGDGQWHVVGNGNLAVVEVDPCLFEREGDDDFYTRVRVRTLAEHEVGVDLRDPDLAPYPNQWGALPEPERTVVNERRLALDDRENDLATKAVEGLHAGALDELRAGQSVEFYRNFNAGGVSAIKGLDDPDANYVFISFDGVVPVAASTVAELIRVEGSLFVPTPACWAAVPDDARVIAH